MLHSIADLTNTLLFALLSLNLSLDPRNLLFTFSKLFLGCLLLLNLIDLNIHVILKVLLNIVFNLRKLLGCIRVAQELIKRFKILLKDIFYTSQLIAIGGSLLRHCLNVLDVASLSFLWMMTKVEWTIFEPLLISSYLVPMLLLLLLI